jgi:hypothetical protein
LFGILWVHSAVRVILAAVTNCRGNYRVHLVWISQGRLPIFGACPSIMFPPAKSSNTR